MSFATYDPGRVVVTFKGVPIVGFMDGTFVDCDRDEDAFTKKIGVQGDTTRTRSRNKGGHVTIQLMQMSPSNDVLNAVAALGEQFAGNLDVGELMIKDLNGTTLAHCSNAWIKKLPKADFGKESGARTWVFDCDALDLVIGGSLNLIA